MSIPISPAAFELARADYLPISHEIGPIAQSTDDQIAAFLYSTGDASASFGIENDLAVAPAETTEPGTDTPNPVHRSIDDDLVLLLLGIGSSAFAWMYLADGTLVMPAPAIWNEFIARENEIELANLEDPPADPNPAHNADGGGHGGDGGDGGGGGDGWGFNLEFPGGLPPVREIVLGGAAFVIVAVAAGIVISGWVEDLQDYTFADEPPDPDEEVPGGGEGDIFIGGVSSAAGIGISQVQIAPPSLLMPDSPFRPHDAEDMGAIQAMQEILQQWTADIAPASPPAADNADLGNAGDGSSLQFDALVVIGASAGV